MSAGLPASEPALWAAAIGQAAMELGFARVAFGPVERLERGGNALAAWLEAGLHGSMRYLEDVPAREDPRQLLAAARTAIVVALSYGSNELIRLQGPSSAAAPMVAAAYARGQDYHTVMKTKLYALARKVNEIVARPVLARPCVDTAPLLERELAALSGLSFTGKNTLAIAPGLGSTFLLGELLVDVELPRSSPLPQGCGSCRACLDACPTQAFVDEFWLDARRCISYLTIEHQGPIPKELRRAMGQHVFGCDICQTVCPYNASQRERQGTKELSPRPAAAWLSLVDLLNLTASGYRRLVRGTALRRASLAQLARNAAVALGNTGDPAALPHLARAAQSHAKALVRGHACWALGELGQGLSDPLARSVLEQVAEQDADSWVREEAREARALFTR